MPRFRWWWMGAHERRWAELASALIDGELAGPDAARLRTHAAGCSECTARLVAYGAIDGRLHALTNTVPPPAAYAIFERAEGLPPTHTSPRVPGRLALAASAVLLVVGGASSPAVRAGVGNAVQYARDVAAPSATTSYAGDRGIFRAPRGSALASTVHEQGLYTTDAAGGQARSILNEPASSGPVYALKGSRVLFQPAGGPAAAWRVADPSGAVSMFPIPPGMQIVDVTDGGDRILLRTPGDAGGYTTDAQATQVIDSTGSVVWIDPGGADVFALSPDGRYALSGEPSFLVKIPLAGGDRINTPITGYTASRFQLSRDGSRAVFLAQDQKAGAASDRQLRSATFDPFGVPSFSDPVPVASPPIFALSPDGRYLAVQEVESGTARTLALWALNGVSATPNMLAAFNGTSIRRLSWSSDGRSLLVELDREGKGEAWIVSPPAGLTAVMPGTNVTAADWLPDGSGLVVESDGGDAGGFVALSQAAGHSDILRLTTSPAAGSDVGINRTPLMTRDGRAVVLVPASGVPGVPQILSKRGLPPAAVSQTVNSWSWSPDGHRAAYVSDGNVYLWNDRGGTSATPLTAGIAAAWSPASDRILVSRSDGGGTIVGLAGNALVQAPQDLLGASLSWSADGKILAGVVHAPDGDRLIAWQPSTNAVTSIAQGGRIGAMAWSPDDRSIAYLQANVNDDHGTVRIAALDGSSRDLASVQSIFASVLWQSNSAHLLYVDQTAPGAPGRVYSVASDGTDGHVVGSFFATGLRPGPR
ncbi:MAG: zf-HC2 domain-containing protein [Dehalococcoidia bacterium]